MTSASERSITSLTQQVAALPPDQRATFDTLFHVTCSTGMLVPPPEMHSWIEQAFGAVSAVTHQDVVKTLNRWTLEGSLFNGLRAHRPVAGRADAVPASLGGDGRDPFCTPLTGTPGDTFGRVRGAHVITASNVAKYDGLHAVVIRNQHHPLDWSADEVADACDTAWRWIQEAHRTNRTAVYPFLMWNCLPRSGASQLHAHMQATLGEGGAYGRIEAWRRAATAYRAQHGRDYFVDFHASHAALGLAGAVGPVMRLAHLTPVKEKETILIAGSLGPDLYAALFATLRCLIDQLGVQAFNVAFYLPPLGPVAEDWTEFPVIVRLVDRGDPASPTSDIGAMELFAQPVVSFDPWRLARALAGG
ncbi:MAG TPA: hypothetical protein VM536_00220 [Chloroflexia bacterium]|nr:hypothetical protein [Chloroflexia bacterium]